MPANTPSWSGPAWPGSALPGCWPTGSTESPSSTETRSRPIPDSHEVRFRKAATRISCTSQGRDSWPAGSPGSSRSSTTEEPDELDLCADFYWHQEGGVARRPATDLKGPAASRPFLEATVRGRLTQLPNVEIRDRCAVAGAEFTGNRMTGVRLDGDSILRADMVVDATGRQARSLAWLESAGYPPPPVDTVEVDTRYVTQEYRRDPSLALDWKAAAVIDEPATRRLAMAVPAEGERWLVLLGGLNGEAPPTQHDERPGVGPVAPIAGDRRPDGGVRTGR